MRKKDVDFNFFRNKVFIIVLLVVILSLGTVFAGNFIIKKDSMITVNDTLIMEGEYLVRAGDYVFGYEGNKNVGLFLNPETASYDFRNSLGEPNMVIGAGVTLDSSWIKTLGVGKKDRYVPDYPLEVRGKNRNNITAFFEGAIQVGEMIISPDAFIDRTFYPNKTYDAMRKIKLIKPDLGNTNKLNHKTLPAEAYRFYLEPIYETIWNETLNEPQLVVIGYKEIEGRDMSAMISINTKGLQELMEYTESLEEEIDLMKEEIDIMEKEIDIMEKEIDIIKEELCKKGNYVFC